MVLRDLEGLVDAFLDRNRRHDDDELREPEPLVQLEDGAQVDVRLARAGLHLHREVRRVQVSRRGQPIAELDLVEVLVDLVIEERQAVTDAQAALDEAQAELTTDGLVRDGELGPTDLLTAEEVTHCFDGSQLEVELGFEVKLHDG